MNTITLDTDKQITINYASFALEVKDLLFIESNAVKLGDLLIHAILMVAVMNIHEYVCHD